MPGGRCIALSPAHRVWLTLMRPENAAIAVCNADSVAANSPLTWCRPYCILDNTEGLHLDIYQLAIFGCSLRRTTAASLSRICSPYGAPYGPKQTHPPQTRSRLGYRAVVVRPSAQSKEGGKRANCLDHLCSAPADRCVAIIECVGAHPLVAALPPRADYASPRFGTTNRL